MSSLLDQKLAAFEASKLELEALQNQLADKIALLENNKGNGGASRASSRPGTGGGGEDNGGGGADGSGGGGGGLAEGWVEMFDEAANATYYFNEHTQETSWTAPGHGYDESDGYDTAGSKGTAVDYDTDAQWDGGGGGAGEDEAWGDEDWGSSGAGGGGGGGGALVTTAGGSEWTEQWDDEVGATYWFNNRTLEASWTEPEGFGGAAAGQTAAAAAPASGEWISYIDDESGAEYWFNEATQETTYEDPHWQAQEQEW